MISEVYDASNISGTDGATENLLEVGTVGWADDPVLYDLGSSGGPSFCKVTLFTGRDITKPLEPEHAQGAQILARVSSNLFSLPPKDTEVLVAWPSCQRMKPGAAVIIAGLSRVASTPVYGQAKEGELCLHPGNADAINRVLMKKDGNISIFTSASGGSVAINVKASDGSVEVVTPYGALVIKEAGITAMFGNSSGIQLDSSGAYLVGSAVGLNGGAVSLGAAASHPVAYGDALATDMGTLLALGTTLQASPPVTLANVIAAIAAIAAALVTINPAVASTSVKTA